MDRSRGGHQQQQYLKQQKPYEKKQQQSVSDDLDNDEQIGAEGTTQLRSSPDASDQISLAEPQTTSHELRGFPSEPSARVEIVVASGSKGQRQQQTANRRRRQQQRQQHRPELEQSLSDAFVPFDRRTERLAEGTSSNSKQQQQQHSPPGSRLIRRSQTSGVQQQQPQKQSRAAATLSNSSGQSASQHQDEERERDGDEGQSLIDKSVSCCSCCCCCSFCCRKSAKRASGAGNVGEQNNMAKSVRLVSALFLAELMGTFLLVIVGDGTIASYVLSNREVDLFTACFAFGVGAMIATFTAAKISGAHVNPAATLAFALDGRLKWKLVPVYMCAQYLGGFLAALVLMVNYAEAIGSFDGGQRSAFGASNSTGHIFATYPGKWVSVWGALLDQIVGTAVLLFSLSAVSDKNNSGLEDRHQPIVVAFVIGLVCVAFNPNCGAIFNPARDLAPRLLTALFGYPSVWEPLDGLYWLAAGVLGPHIGAIVGVFAYKLLIGASLVNKRQYELGADGLDLSNEEQQQQRHHPHHDQQQSLPAASKQQRQPMAKFTHRHHHDSTALGQSDINYGSAGQR